MRPSSHNDVIVFLGVGVKALDSNRRGPLSFSFQALENKLDSGFFKRCIF